MNTYKNSSQLKSLAKGQLLGKYNTVISALLAVKAIEFLVVLLTASFTNTSTTAGLVLSLIISFIIELLTGVLEYGETLFYLNVTCKPSAQLTDIVAGFQTHPDKSVALKFYLTLMTTVPMIPAIICVYFYTITHSAPLFLLSCMTLVAGYGISIYLYLTYSQVFYIMIDFGHIDFSTRELLRRSKDLMNGHRGRLLYIWASFIPLMLVGLFSCGIAYLWLYPYIKSTLTNFYLDIVKVR